MKKILKHIIIPLLGSIILSLWIFYNQSRYYDNWVGVWPQKVSDEYGYSYLDGTNKKIVLPVVLLYPLLGKSYNCMVVHTLYSWHWILLFIAQVLYIFIIWHIIRVPLKASMKYWKSLSRKNKLSLGICISIVFILAHIIERRGGSYGDIATGWPLVTMARDTDVIIIGPQQPTALVFNALFFFILFCLPLALLKKSTANAVASPNSDSAAAESE